MVKERLDPSEHDVLKLTEKHLQVCLSFTQHDSHLISIVIQKVACEGLRTLCVAWKELSENDYQKWAKKLKQASTSMHNRDEQIDRLYEDIETNLKLIGMTAIEDKLQEGVPQCIESLTQAGMKVWMLTGDKTGE